MNIALYMVCPDNLYNPMNLTSQKSVTSTENCLNYLVFSFVLSRYQVVHGFWREILIWGVEWGGGWWQGGGGGGGKHGITGGHRPLPSVILHEVVQVGAGARQVAAAHLVLLLKMSHHDGRRTPHFANINHNIYWILLSKKGWSNSLAISCK